MLLVLHVRIIQSNRLQAALALATACVEQAIPKQEADCVRNVRAANSNQEFPMLVVLPVPRTRFPNRVLYVQEHLRVLLVPRIQFLLRVVAQSRRVSVKMGSLVKMVACVLCVAEANTALHHKMPLFLETLIRGSASVRGGELFLARTWMTLAVRPLLF